MNMNSSNNTNDINSSKGLLAGRGGGRRGAKKGVAGECRRRREELAVRDTICMSRDRTVEMKCPCAPDAAVGPRQPDNPPDKLGLGRHD